MWVETGDGNWLLDEVIVCMLTRKVAERGGITDIAGQLSDRDAFHGALKKARAVVLIDEGGRAKLIGSPLKAQTICTTLYGCLWEESHGRPHSRSL